MPIRMLLLLLLFLCPAPVLAEAAPIVITRLVTPVPVPDGTTRLVVRQFHGDLRVRPGPSGQMEVRSVHQHGSTDTLAGWSIRHRGTDLVLDVHPGPDGMTPARVDLVLRIPSDLRLRVDGRDGRIEVRRHAAPIRVRSRAGAIAVSTIAPLDLRTSSGPILANLQGAPGPVPVTLRTRTGRIDLVLDGGTAWPLRLRGCGISGVPAADASGCHRFEAGRGYGIDARTRGTLNLTQVAPLLSPRQ